MKNLKPLLSALALTSAMASQPLYAGQEWDTKLDLQGLYGNISGSVLRDSTWNNGVFIRGDYLEKGGYTLGYNRTVVKYKGDVSNLSQNAFYGSIRMHLTPDSMPGRLTLRLDGHLVDNNDPTGNTDEGRIIMPEVSYLSADKNLYLDLGYTYSSYKGDLDLDQWTPTVGFGFNQQFDWIQLRGYFINSSNELRTQGNKDTAAIEAKWFHFFKPGAMLGVDKMQLTALAGDRVYAVDPDSASIYNLADVQTGGLSLGFNWKIPGNWEILLVGGNESYENQDIDDKYNTRFAYLDFSKKW